MNHVGCKLVVVFRTYSNLSRICFFKRLFYVFMYFCFLFNMFKSSVLHYQEIWYVRHLFKNTFGIRKHCRAAICKPGGLSFLVNFFCQIQNQNIFYHSETKTNFLFTEKKKKRKNISLRMKQKFHFNTGNFARRLINYFFKKKISRVYKILSHWIPKKFHQN